VALRIRDAIEEWVDAPAAGWQRRLSGPQTGHGDTEDAATSVPWRQILAANRPRLDRPRIYVDVTATATSDLHTGIERVVKGVLTALLQLDQADYRIEPVRLVDGQYVLAPAFALRLLGHSPVAIAEDVVQPRAGDVLLGLDWVADALPRNTVLLDAWRVRGARMLFVVYDLLPVRRPDWFPDGIADMHAQWLQCIGHYADALLCISRFVADDVRDWFDAHPPVRDRALALGYFHPGNDLDTARRSTGLPAEADRLLQRLRASPSFLMVGTVEPRKGHALVLEAIEQLWAEGVEVNLVVVGRQGWMSESLASRMRTQAAVDGRLVWLEKASDEFLEQLYDSAHALVAASEAEGFGLPLVEAARRGLPVIARDIPVFREVSSAFASYFDGAKASSLVDALRHAATNARTVRVAASVPGWEETTARLWTMLSDETHPQWLAPWQPRA
jgi:glycosyltransferase involved in cell wall biosynthesis